MASSRRRRPGRVLVLLALVLLVALLLSLNRFFPGAWPGGGGTSGSRSEATGVRRDPTRVVDAPSPPPPEAERRLHVVVVAPPATGDGAVRVDGGRGAALAPVRDGEARADVEALPTDATLEVTAGRDRVRHVRPHDVTGTLRVRWPSHTLPARVASADATHADVRVLDDAGRPLAGVEVHATGVRGESVATTDASGRARVPAVPFARVCAQRGDDLEACGTVSAASGEELVLSLRGRVRVATRFVDEAGRPLTARSLRLVPREGPPRVLERADGGFDALETSLPPDLVAEGSLEVEVPGRPPARVPLAGLPPVLTVSTGRATSAVVRDGEGRPVAGAHVAATWPAGAGAEPAEGTPVATDARTDATGAATLALPPDRAVRGVVEAPGFAPAAVAWPVGDATAAPTAVTLAPGARLVVRVGDEQGRPVERARVVVRARVGDASVHRVGWTDREGVATLADLPTGRVDVYAGAPGRVWAVADATLAAGDHETRLVLAPGVRLRVVVSDRDGVPIAGVAVRSAPRGGGTGAAPAPTDPDAPPWTTDANGVLAVDGLPSAPLDLYLHRDGYQDEVLGDVRPGEATWFATLVR